MTIETYGIDYPEDFKGFEYMAIYKYYNRGLSRIIKKVKEEKYNDLLLIDVGANIGDTMAVLRHTVFCPILAVEGDKEYFNYLVKNSSMFSDVKPIRAFLGEKDEILNVESIKINGTAHLEKSNFQSDILSLDTLLKNNPRFLSAKFLKIDTDGFDNAILRGSANYLAKAKPIVFMEYDPNFLKLHNDNGIDIFSYLTSLGYEKAIMYANFGEYMFSFSLSNIEFIEEMRDFFYKNNKIPYSDICIFHNTDLNLFHKIRRSELAFFNNEKIV
jgi:FkbM family methyltransferase